MIEQNEFSGLWLCPDFIEPINCKAPFIYKCTGMKLTDKGAAAFTAAFMEEINRKIYERN